ncbi:NF-X1-type zinc finger protein NFXL1 [Coccomyxa sp. Obi]|nr:NF-X1-type zinc finger protein NFXL1 [Coccomyxa sp. Obi]
MTPAASGSGQEPRPLQAAADDILRDYTAHLGAAGDATGEEALALQGPGTEVYSEGINRLREQIQSTQSCADVCLICLENIAPDAAVWTCQKSCHVLLHLICAQAWARQQLQSAAALARAAAEQPDLSLGPGPPQPKARPQVWGCPKCREDYPAAQAPSEYRCMCGAERDPVFNPWLLPHTCGAICRRPLQPTCGHSCVLLCHPGPCPPCAAKVTASCYCGKASTERRRVLMRVWSRQRKEALQGSGVPVRPRLREDARLRTAAYSDLRCDEEAPTCGSTCGKLLACGRHYCADRCHPGECSATCRAMAEKSCACGKTQKLMPCAEPFRCVLDACTSLGAMNDVWAESHDRCERRCTAMRACGRHACKKRCCDGNHPPCDQVCGRRLRCGNHTDPSACHAGACLPCPLTATVSCACGRTTYSLPCGSEASAKEPTCHQACSIPRTCHHAGQEPPHRCHFGACPPCLLPCSKHQVCGHVCSVRCHHPPVPPVATFQPPPPPTSDGIPSARSQKKVHTDAMPASQQVALAVAAAAPVDSSCPPCMVPVAVQCFGQHVSEQRPCSSAAPFCCGVPCGRALPCGNHSCSRPCHLLGEMQADGVLEGCEPCGLPCQRPRSCGHACPLGCHTSECLPCAVEVQEACHCGRSTVSAICSQLEQVRRLPHRGAELQSLLSCGKPCYRQLPGCPHLCEAMCHLGDCPASGSCQKEVTVRCACRRKREKRACSSVRLQLTAQNMPADFDASSAVQLLECDAKCMQIKESKKQKADLSKAIQPSSSPEVDTMPVPAASSPNGHISDSAIKDKSAEKLSRDERARQRELALLERERAERRVALQRMLLEYGPLVVVLLLGVCLFAGLVFWFLMPSKQSEEWVQQMAAEKLRRRGLQLEL